MGCDDIKAAIIISLRGFFSLLINHDNTGPAPSPVLQALSGQYRSLVPSLTRSYRALCSRHLQRILLPPPPTLDKAPSSSASYFVQRPERARLQARDVPVRECVSLLDRSPRFLLFLLFFFFFLSRHSRSLVTPSFPFFPPHSFLLFIHSHSFF